MDQHTVVIAATNPFSLGLMADLLAANGIKTLRAKTPTEALVALRDERPTMLILDSDLDPDGRSSAVKTLRREAANAGVAVMSVAERGQAASATRILGHLARVDKPIDTAAFPRAVLSEIRRHTSGTSRQVEH